ncbi:hypothetical protein LSG31_22315 [Fodinisporobacter ferrooxydans]|uniref:Uncharacterized protein n=1 Tax=Fodinisporobacter ferrooxydans TaxID=2901836 RepID=A0ABY4CM35_9BACL|nr:hypothetical protein LSG31_22315 [Alicyclobacillaceae bacterium MYW30-H2]
MDDKTINRLKIRILQIGKIETASSLSKLKDRHKRLKDKIHDLQHSLSEKFHDLEREISKLAKKFATLTQTVYQLQQQVIGIQAEIVSGNPNNPVLQQFFQSRTGQTVTITTPAGTVTGTVLIAGTNAVELRETATGDIIIVPYSKVVAVQ